MSDKKNVVNVIRLNAWMNLMKVNYAAYNEYRKVHREKHKDRYNEEQRKRYEEDEEYRKKAGTKKIIWK